MLVLLPDYIDACEYMDNDNDFENMENIENNECT